MLAPMRAFSEIVLAHCLAIMAWSSLDPVHVPDERATGSRSRDDGALRLLVRRLGCAPGEYRTLSIERATKGGSRFASCDIGSDRRLLVQKR